MIQFLTCYSGKIRIFAMKFMFNQLKYSNMKSIGYIGAFLGGAIAGAALGLLDGS